MWDKKSVRISPANDYGRVLTRVLSGGADGYLKVSELKQILESMGEKKIGKKAELIDRVRLKADADQLRNYFSGEKKFGISEKGKAYLVDYNDYIQIHKHRNWDIDWREFDKRKAKSNYSFRDIVWGIFNERILKSRNFGRNEYLNMYQLLIEEGGRKRALERLLTVLYIDLSGVEGASCYELYRSGFYNLKKLSDCFNVAIMIAPGIIGPIEGLADVYGEEMVERLYTSFKLPVQICPIELFKAIVLAAAQGQFDEEKYKNALEKEY